MQVDENTTISEFKVMLQDKVMVPSSHIKLLHLGRTLSDENPISFYKTITNGTKLTLVARKPESLKEVIQKSFSKYYGQHNAELLTKEFMKEFESVIGQLSLDDIERYANGAIIQN